MTATAWYTRGPRGAGIQSGAGAPSPTVGDDGDQYLNTTNGDLYKRADGAWTVSGNVKGPTGRGYTGITADGDDLKFAGSDGVTDTVTVPELTAADASATAAAASATAAGGSATAAAQSASDAAASAAAAASEGVVTGSVNGTATSLTLWTGTAAQFAALASKDPNTLYVRPGGISIGNTPVYQDFSRTYTLTVPKSKVTEALTGFPLFVDLGAMPVGFWAAVRHGGGDIRCYAGSTELPREVVSCDALTKTGELHIKTDLSATADTVITITADGVSSDYAPTDPYGRNAVWSNGFIVVSHDGGKTDSTANGFNGALNGTVGGQVAGKLGATSQDYLSTGTYNLGSNSKLQSTVITASAWVKSASANSGLFGIVARQSAWILGVSNRKVYGHDYAATNGNINGGPIVFDNTWHHIALVFQSGVASGSTVYSDGTSAVTGTLTQVSPLSSVAIGGTPTTLATAAIDEVRIANGVRTSAWIATEYANQMNPTTFYTVT